MTKPQAYCLTSSRFEHNAGAVVYKYLGHDYGVAQ